MISLLENWPYIQFVVQLIVQLIVGIFRILKSTLPLADGNGSLTDPNHNDIIAGKLAVYSVCCSVDCSVDCRHFHSVRAELSRRLFEK